MKVNIVPIVQRWNKIFEQLQNMTYSKTLETEEMCKDKWNYINKEQKKISNSHKVARHNTLYWAMNLKDCEKYHLPKYLNEEFHDAIEAFHEERNYKCSHSHSCTRQQCVHIANKTTR